MQLKPLTSTLFVLSLIIFVPPVFAISDADSDGVIDSSDVDVDGDGLIEITTLEQLYNIRNNLSGTAYNDGSGDDSTGCGNNVDILACNGYELSNDLDFDTNADGVMGANDAYWNDGEGWEPIGDESAPFSALLHGNDFTISNLYIDRSSATHLGLFSTTYGATIQNISLAGDLMSITGYSHIGGFSGYSDLSTEDSFTNYSNCSVSGNFAGVYFVGGLQGAVNKTNIINCHVDASIIATNNFSGGVIGNLSDTDSYISYSSFTGDLNAAGYAGGLIGVAWNLTDSFNTVNATITSTGDHVGGGWNY